MKTKHFTECLAVCSGVHAASQVLGYITVARLDWDKGVEIYFYQLTALMLALAVTSNDWKLRPLVAFVMVLGMFGYTFFPK